MERIMKYINKISNYGYAYRENELKTEELRGFHHACLRIICNHPGFSQGQLAKRMFVNKSTITRWLSCMEKAGYIERMPDNDNKRIMRVYPTEKAYKVFPLITKIFDEWENFILEDFTNEEKEALFSMLKHVLKKAMEKVNIADEEEF